MFDIGFWELLVIAVVLLLVMGPERLPEVARQAAFLVRKARQGMFRIRSEMRSELEGTPFEDLENAKREISDFKNDIKQFGRDLADTAEQQVGDDSSELADHDAGEGIRQDTTSQNNEAHPSDDADADATKTSA